MAVHKMCNYEIVLTAVLFAIFGGGRTVSLQDGGAVDIPIPSYAINSSMIVEKLISIPPQSVLTINILNISRLASFVLLQTHSFDYNITLSYKEVLEPHGYIIGTDVGLVKMNGPAPIQFFIMNENVVPVPNMLILVQTYGKYVPVPGGCNMEFSVETAPYLQLRPTKSLITVDAQHASLPSLPYACDDYNSLVHLEMYHMFLPERDFSQDTYLDAIRKMATVESIRANGKLAVAPERGPALRRTFSAYPGTGSVYGVVAVSGHYASAYVPALTYACGNTSDPIEDQCQVLTAPFSAILCALIFFSGLLVCFFGHRYFKIEVFLLGFLAGGVSSYIAIATYNPTFNEVSLDVFSFISGVVFGLLWLGTWVLFGIPIFTVLLATLALGYVIASVAMFAGLGDVGLLNWDVNYWIAFWTIMGSTCVLMSPLKHKANILCCAIVGAFAVITPIDHYIGSNLKFIAVNTMRRATVPEFSNAIIDPPFQWKDSLLVVMWILMSIIGAALQFWLQRGKPPFPPPPFQPVVENFRTSRRDRFRFFGPGYSSERSPLMADAHVPYGSGSSDSVFSSPPTQNDVGTPHSRIGRLLRVLRGRPRGPLDANK